MSSASGAIVVGFSEDFAGNFKNLVDALNEMSFDSDGGQFVTDSDNIIFQPADGVANYPTLSPMRDTIVSIDVRGQVINKHINEITDDEHDDIIDVVEQELIPLSDLAVKLSKHITSGTIYMTSSWHDRQRQTSSEMLSVASNGTAERVTIALSTGVPVVSKTERC